MTTIVTHEDCARFQLQLITHSGEGAMGGIIDEEVDEDYSYHSTGCAGAKDQLEATVHLWWWW